MIKNYGFVMVSIIVGMFAVACGVSTEGSEEVDGVPAAAEQGHVNELAGHAPAGGGGGGGANGHSVAGNANCDGVVFCSSQHNSVCVLNPTPGLPCA